MEALLANYDRLDEDIKAELPLKRIWTVAAQSKANRHAFVLFQHTWAGIYEDLCWGNR